MAWDFLTPIQKTIAGVGNVFSPQPTEGLGAYDAARVDARNAQMGQLGAFLLANAQQMTRGERANLFSQLPDIMGGQGQNIYNAAQIRLLEQKQKREQAALDDANEKWKRISGQGATPVQAPSVGPTTIAPIVGDLTQSQASQAPVGQASQPSTGLLRSDIEYLTTAYPDPQERNAAAAKIIYERSQPKKPEHKEVNGRLVQILDGKTTVILDLSEPVNAELYDRAKAAGIEPGTEEFKSYMLRNGAIAPETAEEVRKKEFAKLSAGSFNKMLDDSIDAGMQANRTIVQVDRLGQLLSTAPQGAEAAIKYVAGNLGIQTQGLSALQATQALINQLVPAQRPPGSGPMSDADLELFKQSLPRLINTPEGNRIILETLRGIAEYDRKGSEIAVKVRTGEITEAEGYNQLLNRADPFANFQSPAIQSGANQGGELTPEGRAALERYR